MYEIALPRMPCRTVAGGNTWTRALARASLILRPSRGSSHYPVLNGAGGKEIAIPSRRARGTRVSPGRDDLPPRPVIGQSWGLPRFTGITRQFSRPLKSLRARSRRRFRSLISTRCREIPLLLERAPACKCPRLYSNNYLSTSH